MERNAFANIMLGTNACIIPKISSKISLKYNELLYMLTISALTLHWILLYIT